MDCEEFNKYWDTYYPESNPIGHELRIAYPDRWLRIHSLPNSKRYAESEDEYQTILVRQNRIISDLFGEGSQIIIVSGQYEMELSEKASTVLSDYGQFEKCQTIALHKLYPEEYEDDFYYDVYIRTDHWKRNSQNELLRNIADDDFRAMFICPKRKCIVAPYDGGLDVIVDSTAKRNQLKEKYKDWLSKREDHM